MLEAQIENTTIVIPPECAPRVLRILRTSALGKAYMAVLEAENRFDETLERVLGRDAADEIMAPVRDGNSKSGDALDRAISRKSRRRAA